MGNVSDALLCFGEVIGERCGLRWNLSINSIFLEALMIRQWILHAIVEAMDLHSQLWNFAAHSRLRRSRDQALRPLLCCDLCSGLSERWQHW